MKKIGVMTSFFVMCFFTAITIANPLINAGQKTVIRVSADQPRFTIRLKSNPTTGYSWFLRDYDASLIQPIQHSFITETHTHLMGAPGYEQWTFRVLPHAFVASQPMTMRFVYMRPWEHENKTESVVFTIIPKRHRSA